jgi:hypothetical protein
MITQIEVLIWADPLFEGHNICLKRISVSFRLKGLISGTSRRRIVNGKTTDYVRDGQGSCEIMTQVSLTQIRGQSNFVIH